MGFNSAFKILNPELNLICHLLALVSAHPVVHISMIMFNIFVVWDNILLHLDKISNDAKSFQLTFQLIN